MIDSCSLPIFIGSLASDEVASTDIEKISTACWSFATGVSWLQTNRQRSLLLMVRFNPKRNIAALGNLSLKQTHKRMDATVHIIFLLACCMVNNNFCSGYHYQRDDPLSGIGSSLMCFTSIIHDCSINLYLLANTSRNFYYLYEIWDVYLF